MCQKYSSTHLPILIKDNKNQSNEISLIPASTPEKLQECKLNEACVESTRCHNGYIRDSSEPFAINIRISKGSKKCKEDLNGKSFFCCQEKPTNSIKPDLNFASTIIKENIQSAPRPVFQNNHHLQNTVAPPVSTLISGVGPLPNQEEINLRFRISNYNPYISPDTPFTPVVKQSVLDDIHENNKTGRIIFPDQLSLSATINEQTKGNNPRKDETKELHIKSDTPKGFIKKGDSNQVENGRIVSPFFSTTTKKPSTTRPQFFPTTKNYLQSQDSTTTLSSITESGTEIIFTTTITEEDYISSTTTTTTPKPYTHNGIPVPLNDHFKNHPPVGCIHKGPEFHLEPLIIPSKSYQLPAFDFDSGEEIPETTETTTIKEETESTTAEIITSATTFTSLKEKNISTACPHDMVCLGENLCQANSEQNLREKLSFRKSSRSHLQCLQTGSLDIGECCKVETKEGSTKREIAGLREHIQQNASFAEDNCGVRRPRSLVSINKSDTFFGEFPWQIMILNTSNEFLCSGALLDKRTIITTATCIHGLNPSNIKIRVGEWDRQNNLQSKPTEDIPIEAVIAHPGFDSAALKNDIALLFTDRNITYDYHVGRVCLPPTNDNFDGRRCISTGWAASRKSANKSSYLKQKDLLVLSLHNCQGRLQHSTNAKRLIVTKSNICARGDKQDVCESDIGDPLVCKSGTGEYQLVGLSSWTGACGHTNVPGIYVNIAHHTNWITTHMSRPHNSNNSSQTG